MINNYFQNKKKMMTLKLKEMTGYPCILTKSAGKNLKDYKIYGNSEQDGTPSPTNPIEVLSLGENSKNLCSPLINGVGINSNTGNEEIVKNKATSNYIFVDFKNNPYYTLSGLSNTLYSFVAAYDSNYNFLGRTEGTSRIKINLNDSSFSLGTVTNTGDISYLRVTQYINKVYSTGTIDEALNAKIQLEKGSIETEYKPYNYVDVVSSGKNLVDIKDLEAKGDTQTINCNITKKITVNALRDNLNISTGIWRIRFKFLDETFVYITDDSYAHYHFPYTINSTSENPIVEITARSTNIISGAYRNIQIEEGTTATTYESYQQKVTTIDMTGHEPLRKIGDVADYIDYKNKKIVRNIGTRKLNEITFTGKSGSTTANCFYASYLYSSNILDSKPAMHFSKPEENDLVDGILCTNIPTISWNMAKTSTEQYGIFTDEGSYTIVNEIRVCVPTTVATTLDEFKSWLATKDYEITYWLLNPVEEPFESPTIPTLKKTCTLTANDEEIEASNIYAKYLSK